MEKILVNPNQEHNPCLKLIVNQPWEYADQQQSMLVDYRLGRSCGLLFLSVKYHRLHPNYIYERLRAVPKERYRLQIILLVLDDPNNWSRADKTVREITRAGLLLGWTVLVAWCADEAARWIESLHSRQHRTTAVIRERPTGGVEETVLVECGLNKTDVKRVVDYAGGSLSKVCALTKDDLVGLRGFGDKKAASFLDALDAPFKET